MRQYRIQGGNRLGGELAVGGAKNAALPILSAVCLNESETVIHNCPRISDIFESVKILKRIGYRADFCGNTLTISPNGDVNHEIPDDCVKKMRSSILFMGALLGHVGRVNLAMPGGCNLGERAINLHIEGLKAMGAKIRQEGDRLFCETDGLRGAKIELDFPSVGATENLMIAAAKAKGETIIKNAAREPEITDLAEFLKKMGVEIRGAGTSIIVINGAKKINQAVEHKIIPDRIVAGTYLLAAAMTSGDVKLTNVRNADLLSITKRLKEMGAKIRTKGSTISINAPEQILSIPRLETNVHPGFPTDMQAQFVAALSISSGQSELTETIFEGRFSHVSELRKMGAKIHLTADKRTFIINGVNRLSGAVTDAHDLRCGAALLLAALSAEGESIVKNAEFVERGYENIQADLATLGAEISLETVSL
ncbi:MAG: UDP-N-acetylglucosamine 1-carboxyvinyltransferase [Defluviitaleaceae bacterium]|nr:UDP-N-acetylglucosamine 1-carboxyvinyltransferase [Defluviitaleaceae bacterium]